MKILPLLLGLGLVLGRAAAAAPLVLDLWPGTPPGDVFSKGPETARVIISPIVGPTQLITNVTHPTLTVYPAPAEHNTGTAMVICPGGGYWDLYWQLEGEEVAKWLNAQGMTGIILKYRVPRRIRGVPPVAPLLDAQRAIRMVRSHAAEWGIDPTRIGIVGFSVGGHLALSTATDFGDKLYPPADPIDQLSSRPNFAVLCYSGYLKANDKDEIWAGLHIPADTPPVFIAHSSDDKIADPANSVVMYLALLRAGIPVELHVYATGNHDFGVREDGRLPGSWTGLCLRWLESRKLYTTH